MHDFKKYFYEIIPPTTITKRKEIEWSGAITHHGKRIRRYLKNCVTMVTVAQPTKKVKKQQHLTLCHKIIRI